MKKPLIGLTLDYEIEKTYSKFPWYAIRENYFNSISYMGGIGIGIPHDNNNIKSLIDKLDGLIITGGNFDIDPNIFGVSKIHKSVNLKRNRTNYELAITKSMLKKNKPVLGICGGEQLINVLYKGTLIQHIPDEISFPLEHEQKNPRNEAGHEVEIYKNTKLYSIVSSKKLKVNSAHHQSIKKAGKGLIINAISSDGVIEGIEDPKKNFCIGVQWHPEFFINNGDKKLIKYFIQSC
ncbi:MAG: gamma-glutamyl-gamma-aminobutyrate hydrolase [Pelagibacterales bacterium]|nr:gamma-glutamyl-gamma-aminobutyrate hydrolase [Pelagibacterales bacterium]